MNLMDNNISNKLIAGMDEVGRGALAGPVIAAAVILCSKKQIFGLTDSKKLNKNKRLFLYKRILNNSISWSLGRAEVEEIDNLNILQATMLAMQRAVLNLSVQPDFILIDGNRSPLLSIPSQAIIKGDSTVMSISAASIIAKIHRDNEMVTLGLQYPEYNFHKNKGYPTIFHLQQLRLYGFTVYHRRSFKPVKKLLNFFY